MKNKFIDAVKSLNRFTTWALTRARDLPAIARRDLTWMLRPAKGGLVLTAIGLVLAFIAIVVDQEDRQSERIFRAWQVVRELENRDGAVGSSLHDALQFLNRESDGAWCGFLVSWIPETATRYRRECLFPRKNRESLVGIRASDVDLMGIDLSGAGLERAYLTRTNLSEADLRNADLRNATLIGADLVRADLSGADLSGADLSASEFSFHAVRRVLDEYVSFSSDPPAEVLEALGNGDLTCAELSEALRKDSRSAGTDLTGADLTGADLTGANLLHANLTGADLSDANLYGANLSCVDFTDADLSGAKMLPAGSL